MNLIINLRVVGGMLLMLGLSHVSFNRYFGWERELAKVSLLTRRIFFVHTFFIGLSVVLAGAVSLFYADDLVRPGALSRAILGGLLAFWACRLAAQFVAYDSAIWRGNRFRTIMHVAFSIFWCYVSATYGLALMRVYH